MSSDNETGHEPESMFRLLASSPPELGKGGTRAVATSVVLHAALGGALVWATLAVGKEIVEEEEVVTIIEFAEEVIPPPPPPPPQPEAPPPQTEIPKGFQTLTLPEVVPKEIPPPQQEINEEDFSGEGIEGGLASGTPVSGPPVDEAVFSFTPYTVRPKCKTNCTAQDILRFVPPLLQRSGVQCDLAVGVRIDTLGSVTATQILKSSGNDSCDSAAEKWAKTTTWTVAYNRDQPVIVWISQPVSITTQ